MEGDGSSRGQDLARQPKRRKEADSLQYSLISGVAGGIAGCVAKTSVAPLDRVKILFQTRSPDYSRYAGTFTGVFKACRDIYAETGMRGLLQGHSATLIRIFPYAAIKFMAYERIHYMLMPTPSAENSGRRFLAGSLAGVTSAIFTYPLELIRVRLAYESHHSANDRASLVRTVKQIYLEPPVPFHPRAKPSAAAVPPTQTSAAAAPKPSLAHFYRGVGPTLVGIVPYAGVSFLVWGYLRRDLFPSVLSTQTRKRYRTAIDLFAGGVAGALGQTASYPLDIIRRRMQVGPVSDPGKPMSFWSTAKYIQKTYGFKGFWTGLSIGYLKVIPMNAVSFATWVGMKRLFGLQDYKKGSSRD